MDGKAFVAWPYQVSFQLVASHTHTTAWDVHTSVCSSTCSNEITSNGAPELLLTSVSFCVLRRQWLAAQQWEAQGAAAAREANNSLASYLAVDQALMNSHDPNHNLEAFQLIVGQVPTRCACVS